MEGERVTEREGFQAAIRSDANHREQDEGEGTQVISNLGFRALET
jgi:hypothetical protein